MEPRPTSEMPDEEFAPVPAEVGDVSLHDFAKYCRSMIDWLRGDSAGGPASIRVTGTVIRVFTVLVYPDETVGELVTSLLAFIARSHDVGQVEWIARAGRRADAAGAQWRDVAFTGPPNQVADVARFFPEAELDEPN